MVNFIFWSIVFYLLFRFVFNFLIPVIRASRHMRRQMRNFQEKMNQANQQSPFGETVNHYNSNPNPGSKAKSGDYIDFEEVRENDR